MQQFIHLPDCTLRTLPRPVAVGIRLQLRLPDRFQYQFRSGLRHSVPYRRYPQRSLPAPRLRDHHPPHWLWLICLIAEFLSEAVLPLLQPSRLDVLEALPIHSWRTMIGSRQFVGMVQNILSIHLVVELVEPEFRLVLRLSIQLDLKFPYLARRCQAHRQSPLLSFFPSSPEARVLPSTGITRLRRYI